LVKVDAGALVEVISMEHQTMSPLRGLTV